MRQKKKTTKNSLKKLNKKKHKAKTNKTKAEPSERRLCYQSEHKKPLTK